MKIKSGKERAGVNFTKGKRPAPYGFLWRKVHFIEFDNFPSASQSSTSNSTINALLSPCHRLHAGSRSDNGRDVQFQ